MKSIENLENKQEKKKLKQKKIEHKVLTMQTIQFNDEVNRGKIPRKTCFLENFATEFMNL